MVDRPARSYCRPGRQASEVPVKRQALTHGLSKDQVRALVQLRVAGHSLKSLSRIFDVPEHVVAGIILTNKVSDWVPYYSRW
jgi:hypothetical protein